MSVGVQRHNLDRKTMNPLQVPCGDGKLVQKILHCGHNNRGVIDFEITVIPRRASALSKRAEGFYGDVMSSPRADFSSHRLDATVTPAIFAVRLD